MAQYKESFLEKMITLALMGFLGVYLFAILAWYMIEQYIGYIIGIALLGSMIVTIFVGLFAFTVLVAYKVLVQKKKHNESIYS